MFSRYISMYCIVLCKDQEVPSLNFVFIMNSMKNCNVFVIVFEVIDEHLGHVGSF